MLRQAGAVLRERGVQERVELVPGSLFDEVPAGRGGYVLKDILHDWNDAKAGTILRNVRRAAAPGAKLFVVEMLLEPDDTLHPGPVTDLQMLVACSEGRQRSEAELRALLEAARFRLDAVHPLPSFASLVEATAV